MSTPTWPVLLTRLTGRDDLESAEAAWAMSEIMSGEATPAQIAAFITLLRAKGETPAELAGLVDTMRDRANPVPYDGPAVDIVGTGADRSHTVNISTMAAIVVAASGRPVVKHGNRAASSSCGTADVLEELGVAIDLDGSGVARSVSEVGIGFCFAAQFHPGMRFAGPVRRELGIPTAFNFLGPLTNPARVRAGAIGCADPRMAPIVARVLADRGDSALVFRGDDGLDELTTTTTSRAWIAAGGEVTEVSVDPQRLGITPVEPAALRGADAPYNAAVVWQVLEGGAEAIRDAVLLNAAAGIAAFDGLRSDDLDGQLAAGLDSARAAVESGAGADLLHRWIAANPHR